jgi:hypothetical protein
VGICLTLATILTELAGVIRDTVEDVTDVDVQVEDIIVVNPTPPCIDMWPATPSSDIEPTGFSTNMGNEGEMITVRARVAASDSRAEQELLLALMDEDDPLSVAAAVLEDTTLNGTASDVALRDRTGFLPILDLTGSVAMISCEWTFMVIKAQS